MVVQRRGKKRRDKFVQDLSSLRRWISSLFFFVVGTMDLRGILVR